MSPLSKLRVFIVLMALLPISLGVLSFRAASWQPKTRRFVSRGLIALNYSHDGSHLEAILSGAGKTNPDPVALRLDAATLQDEESTPLKVSSQAGYVWRLSSDRKMWALSGDNGDAMSPNCWVGLADAQTGKLTSRADSCNVTSLAFSPDGTRLFAGAEVCGSGPAGQYGNWGLFKTAGATLKRVVPEVGNSVQAVVWTDDGRLVWFAQPGGELACLSRDGKPVHRFKLFGDIPSDEHEIFALALAHDNKTLAIAAQDSGLTPNSSSILLVDTQTGHITSS